MADAPAWFVVGVQPGLISQIAGYFKGSSGTYQVYKTYVGHPLYNFLMAGGYGPPYDSYAAAVAAAQQFAKTGKENALPGAGGFSSIPPGAGPKIPNPLHGLEAIGDFFQRLTQPATWVRVGEVALGGILIYAGVRALSHGSAVAGSGARASATRPVKKVATKAAKVVVPEARLATRVAAKKAAPKTTARVAAHRENVRKYGAKKPFTPPPPAKRRPPTVRVSHIYHHTTPKPKTVKKP